MRGQLTNRQREHFSLSYKSVTHLQTSRKRNGRLQARSEEPKWDSHQSRLLWRLTLWYCQFSLRYVTCFFPYWWFISPGSSSFNFLLIWPCISRDKDKKRKDILGAAAFFPPIRITFSLSWENKPDLFPQNTKTGVLSNGRIKKRKKKAFKPG